MAAINEKQDGDLGYVAVYNGRRIELYAKSQYAASEKAKNHFNPPKSKRHMVTTMLCERENGEPVIHTPTN